MPTIGWIRRGESGQHVLADYRNSSTINELEYGRFNTERRWGACKAPVEQKEETA